MNMNAPRMNMNAPRMNTNAPRANSGPGLAMPNAGSMLSKFGEFMKSSYGIVMIVLAVMILIAVYYETIGYYFDIGWKKLRWSRDHEEKIKIEVPGSPIAAELKPAHHEKEKESSSVGSVISALESDVEKALGSGGSKQVFNVARNVYKFEDAEPLCRAFGAELATYDQVKHAYKSGADWCNYGWSKGQLALFPTQKETYEKLQNGSESQRMSCGLPGVNGGFFPNADQRFGVNCYGERPAQSALDQRMQETGQTDIEFDKEVSKFRSQLDSIPVNPWSHGKWSE